ncbi:uncharacterized protein V6R79_023788 [Siganus canaliculatus]
MPFDRFVTTYSNDYKPPMRDPHPWVTPMTLRAAPAAFSLPQTVGTNWERFVTTYRNDYKPFSERHPQVSQVSSQTETGRQEAAVDSGTRALLNREDEAVLKEQKAKEKPDKKFDILLDES